MDSVVKRSLRAPIRKLTGCVSGAKEREVFAKHKKKRSGGGGGGRRGGCGRPPSRAPNPKEPAVICSYQEDLDKERKLREAANAQKNAERAAMRLHFRRKYQLTKNSTDADRLRSFGGKVALPPELAKLVNTETKTKDNGFSLLSAFRGLGFKAGAVAGGGRSKIPAPPSRDPCKVM